MAFAVASAQTPAIAQSKDKDPAASLPLIRDAEIEQLLRDYTVPILRAAGLGQRNIRVVIINDRAFNAFVIDAKRIFVNAGAMMDAETPNQIIGVLAHETGHIAGGHLQKLRAELANAQTASILAMLLGAGAMVAAARTNSVGGDPMIGMVGPQMSIMRSVLAYARQQEEQADKAGVHFLTMTNQSAKGMYDTFKRFADQQLFASKGADPYLQSHPMPVERLAALAEVARTNPYWDKKDPPELQQRHNLTRAKLFGYLDRPDTLYRRYPLSDTQSASALRAGGLDLSTFELGQRHCPDRFADPVAAQQSVFLRAQGAGARRFRSRPRGRGAAAACHFPGTRSDADSRVARPSAGPD